jgi:hypothetical protein
MAVQNPNPPGCKPWRIVTWRTAESKAHRRGWSRKREEWFGTGLAETRDFCDRKQDSLGNTDNKRSSNVSDDVTRSSRKTEPEETGHFGTSADEMSRR